MAETSFITAAELSLNELAALFTRAFEGYFYPGTTTPQILARRVAIENIDLLYSPVLLADDEPAGVALLARRGARRWCGGFGVIALQRGQGLAHALAGEMVRLARASGGRRLDLEVLTRNGRAERVYQRAGLSATRRLLILSWRPGDEPTPATPAMLHEREPSELVLGHFAALHPVSAAWQRESATLLAMPDLQGFALHHDGVAAYALTQGGGDELRIVDFGARDVDAAAQLLQALQARARSLFSVNEPAESPLSAAFLRASFVIVDEQHAMTIDLAGPSNDV